MWMLLRALTAVGAGVWRFVVRQRARDPAEYRSLGEIPWMIQRTRIAREWLPRWFGSDVVFATRIGVPFPRRVLFRLTRENRFDAWFKFVGLAREIQTGDAQFDRLVYVDGDHPGLEALLRTSPDLRETILLLFDAGSTAIEADGEHLWLRFRHQDVPSDLTIRRLAGVSSALRILPEEQKGMWRDRFFRRTPHYFDWKPFLGPTLLTALGLGTVLFLLTCLLLRGSSRLHRVWVTNGVVLAVGVPLSAITIVADTNMAFDRSAPVRFPGEVVARDARAGIFVDESYHVQIRWPAEAPANLPRAVEVGSTTFHRLHRGSTFDWIQREGAWGIPWLEALNVQETGDNARTAGADSAH